MPLPRLVRACVRVRVRVRLRACVVVSWILYMSSA